jgi:hypothetical protein
MSNYVFAAQLAFRCSCYRPSPPSGTRRSTGSKLLQNG